MAVDPNALVTWANAVTVGRILASPLLWESGQSALVHIVRM